MKYVDLHTDALTKTEGVFQVTKEYLEAGECKLQCFAAFISARKGRYTSALELCDRFDDLCAENGYNAVRKFSDIKDGCLNAMLTVEEGGAIEGDLEKLKVLYGRGVRMMTLLWNYENEIGYSNFPDYEGLLHGHGSYVLREERGLKPFGFAAVEEMFRLGMLVDVSHASDGVFRDVANLSRGAGIPFIASHSNSERCQPWARNLTDKQIRTLADCGGVIGLNFCADFLGNEQSAKGMREAILRHAAHILKVGGEDVLAFGSDFDGIPENAYIKNAACMPLLLEDFSVAFGSGVAEKIAHGNVERVFKEVLK